MDHELKTYLSKLETKLEHNFQEIHNRLDNHSRRFDSIDQRFEEVDQQFKKVDGQFVDINQRFEHLENRIEEVKDEITTDLKAYINDSFEAQQEFIQHELGHDVVDHERRITKLERHVFGPTKTAKRETIR
jgi:chromosome segregation ATPase